MTQSSIDYNINNNVQEIDISTHPFKTTKRNVLMWRITNVDCLYSNVANDFDGFSKIQRHDPCLQLRNEETQSMQKTKSRSRLFTLSFYGKKNLSESVTPYIICDESF